ncbi:RHS repeat protein [Pseudomonas sp. URIL14HWK12:I12]|uniref:RHS repeat domain-containing protein n=1 Tax=Pseudomonas sp. URIL14HWK12:I12 TaxID=1261628 RepID=UPI000D5FCE2B|nr:RHS repeat protein [Pseudomonas sp. URIL14HWK12:I12]PVZ16419.1 YD repeat-containing protein [Pseudomonas sp. URIL14HWK12:I12]
MTRDQLLLELKKGNATWGWGAMMAASVEALNEQVRARWSHALSYGLQLVPFTGRINLLQSGTEFVEASELTLGAPRISLSGVSLGRPQVKVSLAFEAGSLVFKHAPGTSSGQLLATQTLNQLSPYRFEALVGLRTEGDAFANKLHVFLDFSVMSAARCDLWEYADGAQRIADALAVHIQASPLSNTQLPLFSVSLDRRHFLSPSSVTAFACPDPDDPDNEEKGAVIAVMRLNADDPEGSLPEIGDQHSFLLPLADDRDSNGFLMYPCTFLVAQPWVPYLDQDQTLPACVRQTSFAEAPPWTLIARDTPADAAYWLALGTPTALLGVYPNDPSLIAANGASLAFQAILPDERSLVGVSWSVSSRVAGQDPGEITQAGVYTPPGQLINELVQVLITAHASDDGRQLVGSTTLTLTRSSVSQAEPLRVVKLWSDHLERTLSAFSASTGPLQWALEAPEMFNDRITGNDRQARYQPPTEVGKAGVALRWAQATNAGGTSRAGLIVVEHEQPLMVEPAFVDYLAPGAKIAFRAQMSRDGAFLRSDGQTPVARTSSLTWSVIGEGSIDADGVYTAPENPIYGTSIIHLDVMGIVSGYAVVRTLPMGLQATRRNTPLVLSAFSLDIMQGMLPRAYANGGQQIEVAVSIMTAAYTDPITGEDVHEPIGLHEIATLTLFDKTTGQELPFLEPWEEGGEPGTWRVSGQANQFAPMVSSRATAQSAEPKAVGDAQRTRVKRLWVHPGSARVLTLCARFTAEGREWDSNEASYTGNTEIQLQGLRVGPWSRRDYLFADRYDPNETRLPIPRLWTGTVFNDDQGNPDYYSMAEDTTTVYNLALTNGERFYSYSVVNDAPGIGSPALNMGRWESDYLGEEMFSYTALAFDDGDGNHGSLDPDALGLGAPLLNVDGLLRDVAPTRPVAGPSPYVPASVPVFTHLVASQRPASGTLQIALERRGGMRLPDTQPADFQAWRAALETPVRLRLRDRVGSLHDVSVSFGLSSNQSSGRNDLTLTAPAVATSSLAPAASLHSNAFNFLSFMQGGVDPRTGQYTAQIALPEVKANQLAGPMLPLQLGFDPMNRLDSGFGQGWSLNLSYVDTQGKGTLKLRTGESYVIDSFDPATGEYLMSERKLPTCKLFQGDAQGRYLLVFPDGTREHLRIPAGGQLALPVRIDVPTGHAVVLEYVPYADQARLSRIANLEGDSLLIITGPVGNTLSITYSNHQGEPATVFELGLARRGIAGTWRLESVVLPTEEKARWAFTYAETNPAYPCLTQVVTPLGAVETISYDFTGLKLPGNTQPAAPRVISHRLSPGRGQPDTLVQYRYSDSNFLGYPDVSQWLPDVDNLYNANGGFTYSSDASYIVGGVTARLITRTYNKLHLLAEEVTTQWAVPSGETERRAHVRATHTEYYFEPDKSFDDQPEQCQLPHIVTRSWAIADTPYYRAEQHTTKYDVHGNLECEVKPNGITTHWTFYEGDRDNDGCPRQPYGFTCHEESRTVYPSALGESGAPQLTTTTRYVQLPDRLGSGRLGQIVPETETVEQAGSGPRVYNAQSRRSMALANTVSETRFSYFQDPLDPLTFGRVCTQVTTLHADVDTATTLTMAYALTGQGDVLSTTTTATGFDGSRRVQISEQSTLTGLMLLEQHKESQGHDVNIRRHYDALQRVVTEIIAPGTEHEATTHYEYRLAPQLNGAAEQTLVDVKGVRMRTEVDGLGRAISEWRREPGLEAGTETVHQVQALPELQTYSAAYDELGQLVSAAEGDDFGPARSQVLMPEFYSYGPWGERYATLGANGVWSYEETDPIGDPARNIVSVTRQWQASGDGSHRSAVQETCLNAFEQPVRTSRYGIDDESESSVYRYFYDGLGRKVREIDPEGRPTGYGYDVFDRNVLTMLPDDAQVLRTYAAHSSDDLPISIVLVTPMGDEQLLGTQTFDGVGRMIEAVTGGRPRSFAYRGDERRPDTVTTPKGNLLRYEYQPRLGEQPIRRWVGTDGRAEEGEQEFYEYDPQDARLLACRRGATLLMERQWYTNGSLRSEARLHDQQWLSMGYDYSVQQRLLEYTDVDGQTERLAYDQQHGGRLVQSTIGSSMTCTLSYDDLGRVCKVATQDHHQGSALATLIEYDPLGREIKRTFQFSAGDEETLEQTYDELDRIVTKTLASAGVLLRHETFSYDSRGHLEEYTCQGPECPQDPYGHTLTGQVFVCDSLDNHELVLTIWTDEARDWACKARRSGRLRDWLYSQRPPHIANGMNVALYQFDNPQDPAQLTGIVNEGEGYPPVVAFSFDPDGNLLNDEWGRAFDYDAWGHMRSVTGIDGEPTVHYEYDLEDVISACSESRELAGEGRFYRDGTLHTLRGPNGTTRIVRVGEHLVAEQGQAANELPPQ